MTAETRLSPDRTLVAIRRGPNDWRVSNGGHYRDQHVADWLPLLPAAELAVVPLVALRALIEAADEDLELLIGDRADGEAGQRWRSDRRDLIRALGVPALDDLL